MLMWSIQTILKRILTHQIERKKEVILHLMD